MNNIDSGHKTIDGIRDFLGDFLPELEKLEKKAIPLNAVVRQGVSQPVLQAEDIEFIWGLIKDWAKEVPSESHSFDPMWFGTTTRDGDIEVHKRLCDILGKPYNIKTDSEQSA